MNSFTNFENFKNSVKFNKERYDLGIKAEIEQLTTLQQFFKDDTIIPLPEGSHFDFEGNNLLIELKSRRCNRLTFCDTAIGVQKILYAKECHENVYFVFQFNNGLYYWKYDPTVELRMGVISSSGIPHWFIPVEKLTPLKV